jgi:hypothetical protein
LLLISIPHFEDNCLFVPRILWLFFYCCLLLPPLISLEFNYILINDVSIVPRMGDLFPETPFRREPSSSPGRKRRQKTSSKKRKLLFISSIYLVPTIWRGRSASAHCQIIIIEMYRFSKRLRAARTIIDYRLDESGSGSFPRSIHSWTEESLNGWLPKG